MRVHDNTEVSINERTVTIILHFLENTVPYNFTLIEIDAKEEKR
jgi:hypothetical protein